MTHYTAGYARYFDRYAVKWTTEFTSYLVNAAETFPSSGDRTILDLCCGGGIAVAAFAQAGWSVTGLDASPSMLDIARDRISGVPSAKAELIHGDARAFTLEAPVSMCISLDGALNHLESTAELGACLSAVHRNVAPGAHFVFDLFTTNHFSHWNHAMLTDLPDEMIMKRGVFDTDANRGMLRLSGVLKDPVDNQLYRVNQVLASWYYSPEVVTDCLRSNGFDVDDHTLGDHLRKCDSGSCSQSPEPCRDIYHAVKVA